MEIDSASDTTVVIHTKADAAHQS